jgi:hypothetical protein
MAGHGAMPCQSSIRLPGRSTREIPDGPPVEAVDRRRRVTRMVIEALLSAGSKRKIKRISRWWN